MNEINTVTAKIEPMFLIFSMFFVDNNLVEISFGHFFNKLSWDCIFHFLKIWCDFFSLFSFQLINLYHVSIGSILAAWNLIVENWSETLVRVCSWTKMHKKLFWVILRTPAKFESNMNSTNWNFPKSMNNWNFTEKKLEKKLKF